MTQPPEPPPIERLLALMARLRDPERGCPWDLEQDFASIAPHTIEEAFEVAEAIERGDMKALCDELGDLLFQIVFYAQMARERGAFDFDAVADGLVAKMVRRHPHVFGDTSIESSEAQTRAWEDHKAEERRERAELEGRAPSVLDGVTSGLPALTRAVKLQKRAARVGFDWKVAAEVLDKVEEEVSEVRAELESGSGTDCDRLSGELGDLLFAVVNLARRLEIDPETALRRANGKFEHRFRRVEELLAAQGKKPANSTLDDMEAAWAQAKQDEAQG
ncbi:MAG TPA: nucleoside triphosphate pyrophosphohydrolase [Alphaproteobacteria bacterium]|nr:nucleoside triphosphate pyrophosphohydrolase [Alphaproteobacteria bacterium]